MASFSEVAEKSLEERKVMALETIAGAARLWIVSNDQVIRCNSTTNSTLSSSVSRTTTTGTERRRRKRRMRIIEQ